ncbi:hypothetical protein DM01DRAFT_1384186 [Hesseltinella vesiculosa]|uniref:Uncharacterized protein n=1 Tax=Hesseltinella vesiculosa TaxID=101127 RepID=A0A1X2GEE6_9FUNG|nr:hypothetical protein DM01DRAFT_1384186 [Hesseltinella vesiculosa]
MQPAYYPRDSSAVYNPSPLGRRKSTTFTPSSDHLDKILVSIRQQIEKWGTNAKWKIDLELTDPGQAAIDSPLAHPQGMPPTATPALSDPLPQAYPLAVSSETQYPWDYTPPTQDPWKMATSEEQEHLLRETLERNHYLEGIVRAQSIQIGYQHLPPDITRPMETLKHIYLTSENEHRLRYNTEARMLHNDIQTLNKRMQRMARTLHAIEDLELPVKDTEMDIKALLEDRKILMRKLQLAQLRLKTRDAEIAYLTDRVKQTTPYQATLRQQTNPPSTASPLMAKAAAAAAAHASSTSSTALSPATSPRFADKSRPYLFQQQYSPKIRSEIVPPSQSSSQPSANANAASPKTGVSSGTPTSPRSGLESLGMLADQMLSDPDFDSQHPNSDSDTHPRSKPKRNHMYIRDDVPGGSHSFRPFEKRSKRSIDSANTLLSMFPTPQEDVTMQDADSPKQLKSRLAYVRWTPDEDQLLRDIVVELGTGNWDKVAQRVPNRSGQQCRQRWSKYLDTRSQGGADSGPSSPLSASSPQQHARHSPAIAALLNVNNNTRPPPSASASTLAAATSSSASAGSMEFAKPRALSPIRQSPPPPDVAPVRSSEPAALYRPPSPVATPKNPTSQIADDAS